MRSGRIPGFVVLLGLVLAAVCLWAAPLEQTLGNGLHSLRISRVDVETKTVSYVPVKPYLGVQGGEKSGKPLCLLVGKNVIMQGLIGFFALPEEIQELETRVKQELGSEARVSFLPPEAFSLQVTLKDREILFRPKAGGVITGIPFQATVEKPKKEAASYTLSLHAVFYGPSVALAGYQSSMMTEASASTQIATGEHSCSIQTVTSSETVKIDLQETHLGEASLTIDETFLLEF